MLAEGEDEDGDDDLHDAAEHDEQRLTGLVGVAEQRVLPIHRLGVEEKAEQLTDGRTDIEHDLVEGGIALAVVDRHIDVLEVIEGGVMSRSGHVLRHADDQHQPDVVERRDEAVHDLERRHDEQCDGVDVKPRRLLDELLPELGGGDEADAVQEDDEVDAQIEANSIEMTTPRKEDIEMIKESWRAR